MEMLSQLKLFSLTICVFSLTGIIEHTKASSKGSPWSHAGVDGQALWGKQFPDCGRKTQSPINIQTHQVKYDRTLGPIELEGYEEPEIKWFTLANNGHTVEMALPSSLGITAQGQHYSAAQLHFHWGSSHRSGGSEHRVDGEARTAELHLVHFNAEKYPNISVALDKADGLAVLAILLEVGQTRNAAYDYILSYLQYIKYKGQKIMIPTFGVHRLLPKQLDKYYTYNGSLTTPPCYQSVLWIIFHQTILLSPDQFENLITQLYSSDLEVSDNIPLINNVRMVQPLNHRVVKASFHVDALTLPFSGESLAMVTGIIFGALGLVLTTHFIVKRLRLRAKMGKERDNMSYRNTSDLEEEVETEEGQRL